MWRLFSCFLCNNSNQPARRPAPPGRACRLPRRGAPREMQFLRRPPLPRRRGGKTTAPEVQHGGGSAGGGSVCGFAVLRRPCCPAVAAGAGPAVLRRRGERAAWRCALFTLPPGGRARRAGAVAAAQHTFKRPRSLPSRFPLVAPPRRLPRCLLPRPVLLRCTVPA